MFVSFLAIKRLDGILISPQKCSIFDSLNQWPPIRAWCTASSFYLSFFYLHSASYACFLPATSFTALPWHYSEFKYRINVRRNNFLFFFSLQFNSILYLLVVLTDVIDLFLNFCLGLVQSTVGCVKLSLLFMYAAVSSLCNLAVSISFSCKYLPLILASYLTLIF